MFDNEEFQKLVEAGKSTGEVIGVDRFLVRVRGLEEAPTQAQVLFSNGDRGLVREVTPEYVNVLNLSSEEMKVGTLAVLERDVISVPVGEELIGRVVSPLGIPLDGKGPISTKAHGEVFAQAPGIHERKLLDTQLVTGVSIVDALFTVVLGQRIAILGDGKSGKSTYINQMAMSQVGSDRIMIFVMISKRKADVDKLISVLESIGALKQSIVVVASIFDSLAQSFLAPYAGAAMGEYLWKTANRDVIMIYDDLSSHARVYREISLLSRVDPGRDSYPGDMFYAHSSLLERGGRLESNGKTMSLLPVVLVPGDDITAYLPTTIMSITDGQIIFDLATFRQNIRPAVNTGLSVSRVGGSAQSKRLKKISVALFKKITDYRAAAQFSHFGSEMSEQSAADFELGKRIYEAFRQNPDEIYTGVQQDVLLATVLKSDGRIKIDVPALAKTVRAEVTAPIEDDKDFEALVDKYLKQHTIADEAQEEKPAAAPPVAEGEAAPEAEKEEAGAKS